ncbi:MAG: hypothetical protein OXP66_13370 [Candidatus Tectomicrobia bacterium]|nr:hypothetical protein [Candidatus Tectomicrobia bacterium]
MPRLGKESPLKLNQGLGMLETWDEDTTQQRAGQLAVKAVQVWAPPTLAPEILAAFHARPGPPVGSTLDDHSNLSHDSPMWPVFEAFRKAVLSLDRCVSEEALKLCVARKAETNFVHVCRKGAACGCRST